ncbi:hypothetical protein AWC14_02980 [Mycobacterium kyorinense]|uniref:Uncharacterized protein n=1 Tax=Mycobacterium kyorinense TaxID=487514 RepID=A0A1X1Y0F8_9MYCO|nr:hypothetical protein AWC14_02980 [Mycobacterium kyorinense]
MNYPGATAEDRWVQMVGTLIVGDPAHCGVRGSCDELTQLWWHGQAEQGCNRGFQHGTAGQGVEFVEVVCETRCLDVTVGDFCNCLLYA